MTAEKVPTDAGDGERARVAKYAEAIFEGRLPKPDGLGSWADLSPESQSYWLDSYGVAAIAVADSEQAALVAENERLRGDVKHWKDHAEEAGAGFSRVCKDYARVAAGQSQAVDRAESAEAALAVARAQVEAVRALADEEEAKSFRKAPLLNGSRFPAIVSVEAIRAALSSAAADTPEPASPDTASEGGE